MDQVVIKPPKQRGRSLERTLEPRRKRVHSSKRSGSRKSKHHDHFYLRLAGGSSKPVKTASMLAMMICSPFFIIFMQVPLALPSRPPPPLCICLIFFWSLPCPHFGTSQTVDLQASYVSVLQMMCCVLWK